MPEKVGESPYLTYIEPGLNKDDISTVGHIHIVQYAQTPNGLAPIEEGGVQTSELGTLYKPVVGGNYFYNWCTPYFSTNSWGTTARSYKLQGAGTDGTNLIKISRTDAFSAPSRGHFIIQEIS